MKDRLISPALCFVLAANFLQYFGFYLLMPVLPFFLSETFGSDTTTIGMALACYTIASLMIRPFSGYLLDTFARKPLYLFAFAVFTAIFAGYIVAGTLMMFVIFRLVHGFAFGMVSVAGNTIVIDITPSSRRGEALGYYGLANNIAMAVGPMIGMFLHDHYSFNVIFTGALISCIFGFCMAASVRTPVKPQMKKEPLSLDRFILLKGLPVGAVLLMLSIPYGMTSTYIAMYGKNIGMENSIGLFFTLLAIGTATARLFSGRQVDKGRITQVITGGMVLAIVCYLALSACAHLMSVNSAVAHYVFYGTALFLGLAFGSLFPAFNTMFVNLAPNNKRATATSTYLTSWDVGIGLGLILGGTVADHTNFQTAYFIGDCLIMVATIIFVWKIGKYFKQNKR